MPTIRGGDHPSSSTATAMTRMGGGGIRLLSLFSTATVWGGVHPPPLSFRRRRFAEGLASPFSLFDGDGSKRGLFLFDGNDNLLFSSFSMVTIRGGASPSLLFIYAILNYYSLLAENPASWPSRKAPPLPQESDPRRRLAVLLMQLGRVTPRWEEEDMFSLCRTPFPMWQKGFPLLVVSNTFSIFIQCEVVFVT